MSEQQLNLFGEEVIETAVKRIDGKVYKTKEKFIEALKNFKSVKTTGTMTTD
jgi:hypothetical protein